MDNWTSCDWGDSFFSFLLVFQNYPLHKLQCHRSLQEDDFLELLRSTFPQLAANVPFDILTVDKNRKLQPLNVESLTPEQVYKAIDSSRINTLFIRLKVLWLTTF